MIHKSDTKRIKKVSFIVELDRELYIRWKNFFKLLKEEPFIMMGLSRRKITIKDAIKGEYPK